MEDKCFGTKYKYDYTRRIPSVYFYYIGNEIVYVGKTINGINKRLSEHYHQNDELSKHLNDVHRIDYMQLQSQADMDMCELFYIYKLRPKYNKTIKSYTEMSKELYNSLSRIFSFDNVKTLYNIGTRFFVGDNKDVELEDALNHEKYSALLSISTDMCEWGEYDLRKIDGILSSFGPLITKYKHEFKTKDIYNFICKNIDEIKSRDMLLADYNEILSTI